LIPVQSMLRVTKYIHLKPIPIIPASTCCAVLDYSRFNSLRKPDTHQLDLRIDKEFYFKKWVLNLYTDIQNAYNFKTRGAPVYTNLDTGTVDASGNKVYTPQTDPNNSGKYLLRTIDNLSGTVLPTIGIIIKM